MTARDALRCVLARGLLALSDGQPPGVVMQHVVRQMRGLLARYRREADDGSTKTADRDGAADGGGAVDAAER